MTDVVDLVSPLIERTGISRDDAERWLRQYRASPERAWRMLEEWLRTGSPSTEPLEGGHSLASLAAALPPLVAFDVVDVLIRTPRVGFRIAERAIAEHELARAAGRGEL